MEIKQLRYFQAVAREGNLSRSASALEISQSMLTRHIQMLEQELGVQLLYRHGHGVSLTEIGQKFLVSAVDIVERSDSTVNRMQALRTVPGGTVTMGMPPMLGEFLLVPLTRRFSCRVPGGCGCKCARV